MALPEHRDEIACRADIVGEPFHTGGVLVDEPIAKLPRRYPCLRVHNPARLLGPGQVIANSSRKCNSWIDVEK
uniref:Uncharacterized protein n=1 Tax=Candidatus Kentrum eta TaxID=2126337 RepID=A0A450VIB9_9GAMM|nr:MAG: hypothetical protein BECKH772B_GA0070898_104251 [Candidatus Kentron sp. H]VFK04471.1 MAG: hypothetical protein BECKH772A_GA0070896_104201 [Candidatus Kentron sp. H]